MTFAFLLACCIRFLEHLFTLKPFGPELPNLAGWPTGRLTDYSLAQTVGSGTSSYTFFTESSSSNFESFERTFLAVYSCIHWIGLSSVLRPRQHGFYRSKDPTNSIKVLKKKKNLYTQRPNAATTCQLTTWFLAVEPCLPLYDRVYSSTPTNCRPLQWQSIDWVGRRPAAGCRRPRTVALRPAPGVHRRPDRPTSSGRRRPENMTNGDKKPRRNDGLWSRNCWSPGGPAWSSPSRTGLQTGRPAVMNTLRWPAGPISIHYVQRTAINLNVHGCALA